MLTNICSDILFIIFFFFHCHWETSHLSLMTLGMCSYIITCKSNISVSYFIKFFYFLFTLVHGVVGSIGSRWESRHFFYFAIIFFLLSFSTNVMIHWNAAWKIMDDGCFNLVGRLSLANLTSFCFPLSLVLSLLLSQYYSIV